MTVELEVLRDITSRLEAAGIDYMLTGSFALTIYAEPRMTRDIDLVVELDASRSQLLTSALADAYYLDVDAVNLALAVGGMFSALHLESVVKVDLVVRKDSAFRRHEFARRRRFALDEFAVWVVTKEDLILSKLAWGVPSGSELQMRDVRALLATGADRQYLRRWAGELGIDQALNELLDE
jgi:hypothetical protein